MSNILDELILTPPSDLCFNCNEFTKDSFSVDQFLQDHRNMGNLEIMRDDLGVYLKTLRSAMIELINKDYADFVNLSSNLIGLDKAITNIQLPIGQLKEELLVVQHNIEDALNEVSAQLEKRKLIRERKRSLKSLNRVHGSLKKLNSLLVVLCSENCSSKSLQLERAAMEFNQLQLHVSRCSSLLSYSDQENIEDIGEKLHKNLDGQFVECLKRNSENELLRILNIYLALDKCSQAEESYRKAKVSPSVKVLINEEVLSSNPRGLAGLYDSLLDFVDVEMKTLLLATQTSNKLGKMKRFDFVVNSFWPEAEDRLELNLSSIYAPGNPDHFFMCYGETLQFLSKLESRCDKESLHKHSQYQSFMHRWNLPVYFQIRFQEIAGSVEAALTSVEVDSGASEWRLVATNRVWQSLSRCWADKVFIHQLTHRFWKLNLQILSRFCKWSYELFDKKYEEGKLTKEVWVCLYSDIVKLGEKLDELLSNACQRMQPNLSKTLQDNLQKSMGEIRQQLLTLLPSVSARLVKAVCSPSLAALRQVSEVPRLYRRTNRDTPTRSLPYIDTMLESPLAFHSQHHNHPLVSQWLLTVFSDITKQYYVAVMDVLTSVQKTEESLRRLKKIRDRSMATGSTPDRGGDDDKIRMQLYFDANYFCLKIEELGLKKENVEQLPDLLKLVETLHSKNGIK